MNIPPTSRRKTHEDRQLPASLIPTATHWGAGHAEVRDGRVVKVHGDPADPAPSTLWSGLADALTSEARLLRPMVRKGYLQNGPESRAMRGREPFVAVPWDEALDLAAKALDHVRKQHGSEAIYGGSYGWASAGRFHHAQSQIHRFLNTIGGYTRSVGTYSFAAAERIFPHIVGNLYDCITDSTVLPVIEHNSKLVVAFGGIPAKNTQVAPGGIGAHRIPDMLLACRKAGVDFVNISPLRGDLDARLEAEWLAPRPNTDVALMLGIAHALVDEELHDQAFLDRYTTGFGRFESYLTGGADGVAKTPEWASAICGIDAAAIRMLARRMASGRTLITIAAGLQRARFGEQPVWMGLTLAAMLGQIGLPGGGFGFGYGADGMIGTPVRDVSWPALPQGRNPVERFIPVARITDMLEKPGEAFEFDGQQLTYPDIRLVYWAGGNPFHHHQDLNRLAEAFRRPETVIVHDHWWTATARRADIVLPAAAALERNDIAMSRPDNMLVAMRKAVEPPGEARTDYAIFSALAERMGTGEIFTEGRDEEAWLREMWARARQRAKVTGETLPDYDTFVESGMLRLAVPEPDRVFLSDFRRDPQAHPLTTPSGRIEIFSEVIASFGYDDCPGHPAWLEPEEWLGAASAARHPCHLISNQPKTRLHSQLDHSGPSRQSKIGGREPLTMHPDDADRFHLAEGDTVRVFNDRGACLAGLRLDATIRPGVVQLSTGAWLDQDPADGSPQPLDRHGNPNVLTRDIGTSRLALGPTAHSALVAVERIAGEPPEATPFTPPRIEKAELDTHENAGWTSR